MLKKKILYGLNGTGSGHITRAREILPYLEKKYDVDILISGSNNIITSNLNIQYRFQGFTFVINNKGNVSYFRSFFRNSFLRFCIDLFNLDLKKYDLVISDFEPISAWSSKINNIPSLQLSHQASLYSNKTPRPRKKDYLAEFFIKWFSPCDNYIGFHFSKYDKNIFMPILRQKIIEAKTSKQGFYVVYLWNYSIEHMVEILSNFKEINFKIFNSNTTENYSIKNCEILPTSDDAFFNSILNCTGVICGAGFELPAEILYLEKRLYVIPIGNQYEQNCNAQALIEIGVDSYHKLDKKHLSNWLNSKRIHIKKIKISDPNNIIDKIEI